MKKVFTVLTIAAFALTAQALTLKEKKQLGEWQSYLKDKDQSYVETFKKNCGYDLPVMLEEKFVTPFMTEGANAASFCDTPRSRLASMCSDATAKAEIVEKVKKVTCKLGKKEEAAFKLNGTELVFTVGVGASNLDDKAKDFFENNL